MSLMYRGAATGAERSRVRLGDVLWAFVFIVATATILIASRPATATGGAVMTLTVQDRQFAIARPDIIALRVAPTESGAATLHILLTAKVASELTDFTRETQGGLMVMTAPGEELGAMRLEEPITGGYLGLKMSNQVRATRIARLIGWRES